MKNLAFTIGIALAIIFALYFLICACSTPGVRHALHGHPIAAPVAVSMAVPAGQWHHVPGYSDYQDFTKKNK